MITRGGVISIRQVVITLRILFQGDPSACGIAPQRRDYF